MQGLDFGALGLHLRSGLHLNICVRDVQQLQHAQAGQRLQSALRKTATKLQSQHRMKTFEGLGRDTATHLHTITPNKDYLLPSELSPAQRATSS